MAAAPLTLSRRSKFMAVRLLYLEGGVVMYSSLCCCRLLPLFRHGGFGCAWLHNKIGHCYCNYHPTANATPTFLGKCCFICIVVVVCCHCFITAVVVVMTTLGSRIFQNRFRQVSAWLGNQELIPGNGSACLLKMSGRARQRFI